MSLPIFNVLDQFCDSLAITPNLLLEAEVGAGKTTVVPLALLNQRERRVTDDDENQRELAPIIVVEPRRVAARSAAQRMAAMLHQFQVKQLATPCEERHESLAIRKCWWSQMESCP